MEIKSERDGEKERERGEPLGGLYDGACKNDRALTRYKSHYGINLLDPSPPTDFQPPLGSGALPLLYSELYLSALFLFLSYSFYGATGYGPHESHANSDKDSSLCCNVRSLTLNSLASSDSTCVRVLLTM